MSSPRAPSWMPDNNVEVYGGATRVGKSVRPTVIAQLFDQLAAVIQITDDQYRAKAFSRAAKIFRGMTGEITRANIDTLQNIRGIGPGIITRVSEIIETGTIAEIDTLRESRRYNAFVELTSIKGVGAKTAAVWINLGVYTLGDLRRAVGARSIVLTKQQELGVRWYADLSQRIPRATVEQITGIIRTLVIRAFGASSEMVVAGSYRRGATTSGDIDILVQGTSGMDRFVKLLSTRPEFTDIISSGRERTTFLWRDLGGTVRQIDVLLRPKSAWAASLAYFTGDAGFARNMRAHAKTRGYKLNQNGLYKKTGTKTSIKPIPIGSEEELFKVLGIPWVPPAQRTTV